MIVSDVASADWGENSVSVRVIAPNRIADKPFMVVLLFRGAVDL
jgi:hypothetical protein